jgi:hypothetical protein
MTEKQIRARIERLQQLIAGLRETLLPVSVHTHPHAAELTLYTTGLQIAYTVLGRAKETLERVADAMNRAKQPTANGRSRNG